MLHTVNLYVSLRCATGSHEGVRSSVVSGGVINHQEVFGPFTLNSVSGAHSCRNLNTIFHPGGVQNRHINKYAWRNKQQKT